MAFEEKDSAKLEKEGAGAQLEVRAVFINCEPQVLNVAPDSEVTRFERNELFKHSVLKECIRKLALTVKITSDAGNTGVEYLPIEHVFEGTNEKRVRLLNPYVLRLRRDMPRQAYKLRRLDTVSGVITHAADVQTPNEKHFESSRYRNQRDVYSEADVTDKNKNEISYSGTLEGTSQFLATSKATSMMVAHGFNNCENNNICLTFNNTINTRCKRNEHNVVVETVTDGITERIPDDNFYRGTEQDRKKHVLDDMIIDNNRHKSVNHNHKKESMNNKHIIIQKSTSNKIAAGPHVNVKTKTENSDSSTNLDLPDLTAADNIVEESSASKKPYSKIKTIYSEEDRNEGSIKSKPSKVRNASKKDLRREKSIDYGAHIVYTDKKDYAIYEIGPPELWHQVHTQMFEKLSTPEGKTVWNDLTKGELASVGSMSPEWTGQDLNVRYRSTKWIPREEFTLPSTSRLCVLVPLKDGHVESYPSANPNSYAYKDTDYIVVPDDDIIELNEDEVNQNDVNSALERSDNSSELTEKDRRIVMIRVSREVLKGNADKLNIVSQGTEKYLTLRHRRPLSEQIDLEARADENELVRVGATGRISIAVADATRRKRTIFNLQVGNTGLAAARFRVEARDCYPLFDAVKSKEVTIIGPVLIPPRHTRSLRLELPDEIPADVSHCSVALLNDEGQSVAVREVAIKKDDRCFCVWHCDCVCLSVDPKLICRDMDEARQKAAGLVPREDRTRQTRSICYPNHVSINVCTIIFGSLLFLLFLGTIKAVLGLMCSCIGTYGISKFLVAPRRLNRYYEHELQNRTVKYNCEGWPIHPDTKQKTVHLVSGPMEFILNLIFFICLPGITIYDLCRKLAKIGKPNKNRNNQPVNPKAKSPVTPTLTKEIFSTNDMQIVRSAIPDCSKDEPPRWRRRRRDLHSWMTPRALELSTDLWKQSLKVHSTDTKEFVQPLLCAEQPHRAEEYREADSARDSEQDDTEYVLSQMQKSKECLARSQIKINNLDSSSVAALTNSKKIIKSETKVDKELPDNNYERYS